jgi:hypothetical protein
MMFRSSFTPFFFIQENQPFSVNKCTASQSSPTYSLITGYRVRWSVFYLSPILVSNHFPKSEACMS